MWCSDSRLIDERTLNTASVTSNPLRGAFLARVGSCAGRGACFSDATSTLHQTGWLMTITQVGWYHVVLIQRVHRPLGAAYALRNVKSVTQAAVCGGLVASIFVILRPRHIERAGSWASHTSGGIMWCSYSRPIDQRALHAASVTSSPLLKPPSDVGSKRAFYDSISTYHRAGRLMTMTHVGWYHMVLRQPPN